MGSQNLVVSNPPHGDVDFLQAGQVLGLAATEIRMKANYPVPEIWLADTDKSRADETAEALGDAGLSVVTLLGEDFAAVPKREVAKSFELGDTGLKACLNDEEVEIGYQSPVIGVFCQPLHEIGIEEERASTGGGRAERKSGMFMSRATLVGLGARHSDTLEDGHDESEESPFLDLYLMGENSRRRIGLVQRGLDFSGLGDLMLARASDNMAMLVAECDDRFSETEFDRRLANMHPRKRLLVGRGMAPDSNRKGFSFATVALSNLLESISPDLKDITQFELASRLVFLTRQ